MHISRRIILPVAVFLAVSVVSAATFFVSRPVHAAQTAVTVRLTNSDQFVPAAITIKVGQTVRWDNVSNTIHTVTDDAADAANRSDSALPKGAHSFHSGFLKPGQTFTHRFIVPGIYRYFCIPHEGAGMLASIVVLPLGEKSHGAAAALPKSQSAPIRPPAAGVKTVWFPSRVYVTLQRSNAVEVFPEQRVWKGFPQAHYIAIGPRSRRLLISGFQNGNAYVADGRTGRRLATFHLGGLIQGVMIDPSGRYGMAVDAAANDVAVIDLQRLHLAGRIPVGKTPHNVVFSRRGRLAYVTIQNGRAVDVVDMRRLAVVRTIELPQVNGPHNIDRSADGSTLYVRSYGAPDTDGEIATIDLSRGKLVHLTKVGLYHGGVDSRPSERFVYTTNIGASTIDILDAKSGRIRRIVDVGAGPHGIRLSPDGRFLYTATTRADTLVVIDARDLHIVDTIPLRGQVPFWLSVEGNT